MTTLLTFAPPADVSEATVWVCDDRACTALTVAGALAVLFAPDKIVVFAQGETGHGVETVVPLPDCDSEVGLWACFEAICGAVGEDERLIVDLTHATGPLPFVVFLSLPYLRELKGASIDRVFYGARVDRTATELPVHDLTPFVEVLDWVGAVHGFLRHLDADALAELFAGIQDRAHRQRRDPPPRQLKPFANNLARFASAVRLARPTEAFLAAHLLLARLDQVEGEVAADLPALVPLVERIGRLAPLSDEEPFLDGDLLRRQQALVRYQLDHGLLLQAVELGREWLVNLLVLRLGCPAERWLDWQVRETVGRTATGAMLVRQHRDYDPTNLSDRFEALPDADGIASVWQAIGELRNDLAHCGMNEQPKAVRVIERRAAAVIAALEALA
jgi:hypothetical protein